MENYIDEVFEYFEPVSYELTKHPDQPYNHVVNREYVEAPESLIDIFECRVCNFIPISPVKHQCNHITCALCWRKEISKNHTNSFEKAVKFKTRLDIKQKCPSCENEAELSETQAFIEWDKPLRECYEVLQMKCRNGCGKTGNIREVYHHEVFQCNFRIVECPNLYCEKIMPVNLALEHVRKCEELILIHKCGMGVRVQNIEAHDCAKECRELLAKYKEYKKRTEQYDYTLNNPMKTIHSGNPGNPVFKKRFGELEEMAVKMRQYIIERTAEAELKRAEGSSRVESDDASEERAALVVDEI